MLLSKELLNFERDLSQAIQNKCCAHAIFSARKQKSPKIPDVNTMSDYEWTLIFVLRDINGQEQSADIMLP